MNRTMILPKGTFQKIVERNLDNLVINICGNDLNAINLYLVNTLHLPSLENVIYSDETTLEKLIFKLFLFKEGTLLNFSNNGIFSKAIKYFTASHWSHTGIIYNGGENNITTYESLNEGFVRKSYTFNQLYNKFMKGKLEVGRFEIPIQNSCKEQIQEEILSLSGKKYGWWSIGWIGVRLLFNNLKIKDYCEMKELTDGEKTLICSEAAARLVKAIGGIDLSREFYVVMDSITPAMMSVSKNINWVFRG